MIKHYCDCCGKEIDGSDFKMIEMAFWTKEKVKINKQLCRKCFDRYIVIIKSINDIIKGDMVICKKEKKSKYPQTFFERVKYYFFRRK